MDQSQAQEMLRSLVKNAPGLVRKVTETSDNEVVSIGTALVWDDLKGHILRAHFSEKSNYPSEIRCYLKDMERLPYWHNIVWNGSENLLLPESLCSPIMSKDYFAIRDVITNEILTGNEWHIKD